MTILFFSFAADGWSVEASQAIVELTQYRTLQAQIASYTDAGQPEIHLYSYLSPNVSEKLFTRDANCKVLISKLFSSHAQNVVFINKELVARNYAEWCDPVSNA